MNYDERIDETPQTVQDILSSFDEMKDGYSECARIIEELNTIGWTAEYGLDAELYELRNIQEELERLKDTEELTEEDYIFLDRIHALLELDDEVCLKMNGIEQVEFYLQKL